MFRQMAAASIVCIALGAGSAAAQAPDAPAAPSTDQQIMELRQALAESRLALKQLETEVNDIRAFLAEKQLDEKLEAWREERAKLERERRLLKQERRRLEAARRALHQVTMRKAQRDATDEREAEEAAVDPFEPRWSSDYMLGLIDSERETVFVTTTDGSVLVEQHPGIDRRNVMVRGTFLNESRASWRYTFEIRIGGDQGTIAVEDGTPGVIGRWRYQTPVLTAGEMHSFEVKVPVTNVAYIRKLQIGKVVADLPNESEPVKPKDDEGRPTPAKRSRY